MTKYLIYSSKKVFDIPSSPFVKNDQLYYN